MALSVNRQATDSRSRLTHISLLALNLRLMENWRSLQITAWGTTLDYESTMIVMAIIVISSEKLLRAEINPDLETLAKSIPQEHLSKVNLSSISAATAINRETVRRKVNELALTGIVVTDERGVRLVPDRIQFAVLRQVIDAQLDAIVRTVNQLSKLCVLVSSASTDS